MVKAEDSLDPLLLGTPPNQKQTVITQKNEELQVHTQAAHHNDSPPPKVVKEEPISSLKAHNQASEPLKVAKYESSVFTPSTKSHQEVHTIFTPYISRNQTSYKAARRSLRKSRPTPYSRTSYFASDDWDEDSDDIHVMFRPLKNDDTHIGIHFVYDEELIQICKQHRARWDPLQKFWTALESDAQDLFERLKKLPGPLRNGNTITTTWYSEKIGNLQTEVTLRLDPNDEQKLQAYSFDTQELHEIYSMHGGCNDRIRGLWIFPKSAYEALHKTLAQNNTVFVRDKVSWACHFEERRDVHVDKVDGEVSVKNLFSNDLRILYRSIEGWRYEGLTCTWKFPVERLDEVLTKLSNEPGVTIYSHGSRFCTKSRYSMYKKCFSL